MAVRYHSCWAQTCTVRGGSCRLTVEPAKGGPSETIETDVVLVSTGEQQHWRSMQPHTPLGLVQAWTGSISVANGRAWHCGAACCGTLSSWAPTG